MTASNSTSQPFYLQHWLTITLTSIAAAVGTILFVLSSLNREEGWSIIGHKDSFVFAAKLGDQSPDGIWITAVSSSQSLRSFDPAVILMLTEVECEAMRYRIRSSVTHTVGGDQKLVQPNTPPAWKPVPPASAGTIEHPVYQIACHPNDLSRQPLRGTPFDLRQTLLKEST